MLATDTRTYDLFSNQLILFYFIYLFFSDTRRIIVGCTLPLSFCIYV